MTVSNEWQGWILSEEKFWPRYLRELGKLKAEVKRSIAAGVLDGRDYQPGRLFGVNRHAFPHDAGQQQATELDLSKAYLTSAALLGLIAPETEARIGLLPKRWRLRVLGAIATRRQIVSYDNRGNIIGRHVKTDLDGRRAWTCICGLVDRVLRVLCKGLGDRFAFYWYDNLWSLDRAELEALAAGLEFSYKLAEAKLEYAKSKAGLTVVVNEARPFFLPGAGLELPAEYVNYRLGELGLRRLQREFGRSFLEMADSGVDSR